jgi:hypothetical protein
MLNITQNSGDARLRYVPLQEAILMVYVQKNPLFFPPDFSMDDDGSGGSA